METYNFLICKNKPQNGTDEQYNTKQEEEDKGRHKKAGYVLTAGIVKQVTNNKCKQVKSPY